MNIRVRWPSLGERLKTKMKVKTDAGFTNTFSAVDTNIIQGLIYQIWENETKLFLFILNFFRIDDELKFI